MDYNLTAERNGFYMSVAIVYLPKGYSFEQKQCLITKTKAACMAGLRVTEKHSSVFIRELEPDCMDDYAKNTKYLFVYTTLGKTPEGKDLVCRGFDEACAEVFGEEKGRTIVLFKEHSDENAGSNGYLRPVRPQKPKK